MPVLWRRRRSKVHSSLICVLFVPFCIAQCIFSFPGNWVPGLNNNNNNNYRPANAILGEIGRIAPEEVVLQLIISSGGGGGGDGGDGDDGSSSISSRGSCCGDSLSTPEQQVLMPADTTAVLSDLRSAQLSDSNFLTRVLYRNTY